MRILISILCSLSIFNFMTFAQTVVPSERVKNFVIVRVSPSTSSSIVRLLGKGESAELIESIPYWYKVRCNNQLEDYVSKAWTDTVQDPDGADNKDDLIIGSWNIKWFGFYKEDKHNYPAMVDIIQNFDVLAIQELRGGRFKDRLDSLLSELNKPCQEI